MSSNRALLNELHQLNCDIQSEKISVRIKSLKRLDELFNTRIDEVKCILDVDGDSQEDDLNWNEMFDAGYGGIIKHMGRLSETGSSSAATREHQKDNHSLVLQKIVYFANADKVNISYSKLFTKCLDILDSPFSRRYFGWSFLQMIEKNILLSKADLTIITYNSWKELLDVCFSIYGDVNEKSITHINLSHTIYNIICCGTQYSYLAEDFPRHLIEIKSILLESERGAVLNEWLKITLIVFKHIILNNPLEARQFIYDIFDKMCYSYNSNTEIKETIFEIAHISLVIYCPDQNISNKLVSDTDKWKKMLRSYMVLVETEIKALNSLIPKFNRNPEMNEIFLNFATNLCYLMFWDTELWNESSNPSTSNDLEQSTIKRVRRSNKLQSMYDLIGGGGKFNWRWFIVFSNLLKVYPQTIEISEDISKLLKFIVEFQPTVQFPVQIKAILDCCVLLIEKEESFNANYLYVDLWDKLATSCYRSAASNTTTLLEYHELLAILIQNKRFRSPTFTQIFLKDFSTKLFPRTKQTFLSLSAILTNFDVDAMEGGPKIINECLNWIHSKSDILKDSLKTDEQNLIQRSDLAELTVLCILTGRGELRRKLCIFGAETEISSKYLTQIAYIRENLLYLSLDSMIVTKINFEKLKNNQRIDESSLSQEIRAVLDEKQEVFVAAVKLFKLNVEITQGMDIGVLLSNVEIMLEMLNCFISFGALSHDLFEKSFLLKRLNMQLQMIEQHFELNSNIKLETSDVIIILNSLDSIFSLKYHSVLAHLLRQYNFFNVLNWTITQLNYTLNDSKHMEIIDMKTLERRQMVRFKAFRILTIYGHYTGIHSETIMEFLDGFEFNLKNNVDLNIVLFMIKQMCFSTTSESKASWILTQLQKLCAFYKNIAISEKVVELFADSVIFIKPYNHFNENAIILINAFFTKCKKRMYTPEFTIKTISQLKYLVKTFPAMAHENPIADIIKDLTILMMNPIMEIRLEALKCFAYIYNPNWVAPDDRELDLTHFYEQLFCEVVFDHSSQLQSENDRSNGVIIHTQFLTAVFTANYYLRKNCFFNLLELFYTENSDPIKIYDIFTNCCNFINVNISDLIEDNFEYILSNWLKRDFMMSKFPWNLTSDDSSSFFNDYRDRITLSLVLNKWELLASFSEIMNMSVEELIVPILPSCLAILLPHIASIDGMSEKYTQECLLLRQQLFSVLSEEIVIDNLKQNSMEVIAALLFNLNDQNMFLDIFEFDIKFCHEQFEIDNNTFEQCLRYIQTIIAPEKKSNILIEFIAMQPVQIFQMLNRIRIKMQNTTIVEQKLLLFLQFCCLMNYIARYLKGIVNSQAHAVNSVLQIKEFFLRDACYFFCNLMANESDQYIQLNIASCRYLKKFVNLILPECAPLLPRFFNYIVSTLIPLCKHQNSYVASTTQAILRSLFITHQLTLHDSIEKLDEFPSDEVYQEYAEVYKQIKYRNNDHSLVFEINHFLNIESGKVQGLAGLREQLEQKKEDLVKLYQDLTKIRGFSEDCEQSILHKLTFKLLKCVQSNEPTKSFEAAKCLGELGPSDLTTMVLMPTITTNAHKIVNSLIEALENVCNAAFEKLDMYFLHPAARALEITCLACVSLAGTKIAQKFIGNYPNLQIFAFRARKTDDFLVSRSTFALNAKAYLQNSNIVHSAWIKKVATDIFMALGDKALCEVSKIQTSFAERLLPLLFQVLLFSGQPKCKEFVCDFIKEYIDFDSCVVSENSNDSIFNNPKTMKCVLDVVESIRLYKQIKKDDLNLNWIKIATIAIKCDAYFTAIMYCEIYFNEMNQNNDSQPENEKVRDIMKTAYIGIGDEETASAFLNPLGNRLEYLKLTHSWQSLLLSYDAYRPREIKDRFESKKSLVANGFYNLASMAKENSHIDYECFWRMADWNISVGVASTLDKAQFDTQHYSALKCLHNLEEINMNTSITLARMTTINKLKVLNLECTKNIYKRLLRLQMLQQLEDLSTFQFNRSDTNSKRLITKWMLQDTIPSSHFTCKEPIMCQRAAILNAFRISAVRSWSKVMPDPLQNTILKLMKEARKADNINLAIRNRALLQSIEASTSFRGRFILEDAKLQWVIGDRSLAKKLIKSILMDSNYDVTLSKVVALRLYGEYLAESQSENPMKIYNDYFHKASDLLAKFTKKKEDFLKLNTELSDKEYDRFESKNRLKIYEAVAKYIDREYVQKIVYLKSEEFLKKKKVISKNEETVRIMTPKYDKKQLSKDELKTFTVMTKNLNIDKAEIKNDESEKENYLVHALQYYIRKCVFSTMSSDLSIFRIISLWLSNKTSSNVETIVESQLKLIPSHKILPVLTQVSAHLSSEDKCGEIVESLLERCANDHPHHTLYSIFAIANSYKDSDVKDNRDNRVKTAKKLIEKLKKSPRISAIVNQMEHLCTALITFANEVAPKKGPMKINFINKLNDLNALQCPTVELPVAENCVYENIVSIHQWSKDYELVGGINAPKKIFSLCSDGVKRSQLIKGKDDLRQDAVMQQVFTIINSLLKTNKETNKRKLTIRTYKVVPLSQRSGLLEWCDNTMPMGEYLVGNLSKRDKGAHVKYNPSDWSPADCRNFVSNYANQTIDYKIKAYAELCSNFKPVFHNFFIERFINPGVWFERRMAYVNSIATNSMIGYVLGLGDRHVMNILIDQITAEVIHIDFGIAFDQAKILPTPETIPFRLTRDIVAPMGISGVEGQFRKSCEKTMAILRQNQMTISTILEVLLYDPLYAWKLTSKDLNSRQSASRNDKSQGVDDNGEETNITAERALITVRAKLMGEECGATGMSTIESQIDRLIAQAVNPTNLCRLFAGWQSYL